MIALPLLDHVLLQEVHEEVELLLRPLPVLAGKAIERELLDAQPGRFLGDAADARDAAAVPLDARQAALPGPTPVAVHDDGDVPRHLFPRHVGQFAGRCSRRAATCSRENGLLAVGPDGNHLHRADPRVG